MSALISDVKTSVGNYKAELTTLSKQTLNVNRSICNLDDAIKSTQTSIETQELSIDSLEEFRLNCEDYFAEVDYTDSVAADAINQNR
jgi:peptidoglycan hydrolase CwlO-like protein